VIKTLVPCVVGIWYGWKPWHSRTTWSWWHGCNASSRQVVHSDVYITILQPFQTLPTRYFSLCV